MRSPAGIEQRCNRLRRTIEHTNGPGIAGHWRVAAVAGDARPSGQPMGALLMPAAAKASCTCCSSADSRVDQIRHRLQACATAAAPTGPRHSINNWVNQWQRMGWAIDPPPSAAARFHRNPALSAACRSPFTTGASRPSPLLALATHGGVHRRRIQSAPSTAVDKAPRATASAAGRLLDAVTLPSRSSQASRVRRWRMAL